MPQLKQVLLVALMCGAPRCLGAQTVTHGPAVAGLADMIFCVGEVNRYRATVGLAALARSTALETYAAESARVDHAAGKAHEHLRRTNGGGIAMAETEVLRWPAENNRVILKQGLAQMWAEGHSGVHYQILTGPYTRIGCGAFSDGTQTTVVQAFH
jgi:uncharacterized protein YkwD